MLLDRRAVLATLVALPLPVLAHTLWPSRPIRIIVPFGLGGSADVAARFLAEPLVRALGRPVTVDNRPGAGAVIGTEAVVKAPADGHTLLLVLNTHTANETLLPNRPYALMRDLTPVAAISIAVHVLAVHPSLGARSVADLIAKEGRARHHRFRLIRHRHPVSYRRGSIPGDGRHRHQAWPVQQFERRPLRSRRGRDPDDVRCHSDDAGARRRRPCVWTGDHRHRAKPADAGVADGGGDAARL
jgi:hypothetical protein